MGIFLSELDDAVDLDVHDAACSTTAAPSAASRDLLHHALPGQEAMKRLTLAEKYAELKRQTEAAGMMVTERNRRLIISRKKSRTVRPSRK
jgi:hypothetical protein